MASISAGAALVVHKLQLFFKPGVESHRHSILFQGFRYEADSLKEKHFYPCLLL